MKAYRATYAGFPNAQRPPFVLLGEVLGSNRYWHGATLTHWANDWVSLMTGGKGNFVMTAMEDQGVANALFSLNKMGKVDFQRVLFLRTASNYCMPAPKQNVVSSLTAGVCGRSARHSEAAQGVGSVVVHDIVDHWDDTHAAGDQGAVGVCWNLVCLSTHQHQITFRIKRSPPFFDRESVLLGE